MFSRPATRRPRRVFRVHAIKRERKAIGIALAPDLAIRDDVDSGTLHVPNGDQGGIVLRFLEKGFGTRQMSLALTRGTSRERSSSRSTSHSGCG